MMREKILSLLHYSLLAPSNRNTQPWRFLVAEDKVVLFPDMHFWLPISDPEKIEIYMSLGCALENLLVAARHFGLAYAVSYLPKPQDSIEVRWKKEENSFPQEEDLFAAIEKRRTNYAPYEERHIEREKVEKIKKCASEKGITLYAIEDQDLLQKMDEQIQQIDMQQYQNPSLRKEIASVFRNMGSDPELLIEKLGVFSNQAAGIKEKKTIPFMGILCTTHQSPVGYIQAGQVFEKIFLTATALDLKLKPIAYIRKELKRLFPLIQSTPLLAFTLGYAPHHPLPKKTKSLEDVLI